MLYIISLIFSCLIFLVFTPILFATNSSSQRMKRRLRHATSFSGTKHLLEEHVSLTERVLGPAWERFTFFLASLTPVKLRRQVAEKLVEAGNPHGLRFDGFIGLIAAMVFVGSGVCLLLGIILGLAFTGKLLLTTMGGLSGLTLTIWQLQKWINLHKRLVLRQLPEALDILTISVEAGLSFDAALAKLIEKSKGPLIDEFARMLKEISMGKNRSDAINDLGKRKKIDDLTFFTTALAHSDKLGVPIASILRVQADEIRRRYRQRIEFEAMQTPIKMIFPLALCIFPALMIVLLAPAALMILDSFMFK